MKALRLMSEESSGVAQPGPGPGGQPGKWIAPTDWHGICFMRLHKNGLPDGADMLILGDPLIFIQNKEFSYALTIV